MSTNKNNANKTSAQTAMEQAAAMRQPKAGESVHKVAPARTAADLLVDAISEDINNLIAANNHPDYIFHQIAATMQRSIPSSEWGEYQSLVANRLGLDYSVKDLSAYDITTPVDAITGRQSAIDYSRQIVDATRQEIKDGKVLSPSEMAAFNTVEHGVSVYEQEILKGATPEQARLKTEQFVSETAQIMSGGLLEGESSWLQPKYIAGATALVAAGVDIVAKGKFTVGAIGGGVAGVAASYFAADYAYKKLEMLQKLDTWIISGLAAALGASLGLGAVRLGEFVENRFFGNIEVTVDATETPTPIVSSTGNVVELVTRAIPAETAEMNAYF